MKSNPLVSVVIPVYNQEKYLSECIESVLAQTYTNYECIILNNASIDLSLDIAKHYEKLDNRIAVHNNNHYLSMVDNFNASLKLISPSSKYCKMILSDDFIYRDCIEKMVEIAETDNSIGIVSSYRMYDSRVVGVGLPYTNNQKENNVFDGRYIGKYQLSRGDIYIFGTETTVLYRSEIIRNRDNFFNNSILYADTDACYEILKYYKFGFVYQVLSFTRKDDKSLTSTMAEYRTGLASRFYFLVKYGKCFLDNEEYCLAYESIIKEYYAYLGWKLITQRKIDFWTFHEEAFKNVGLIINKHKLYWYAGIYCMKRILNPINTIQDILRKYIY